MYELDGMLMFKDRIVIPQSKGSSILKKLHSGHQGVSKMKERGIKDYWWPMMCDDIEQMRAGCSSCDLVSPSQPASPPQVLRQPDYPLHMISSDYFEYEGHQFVLMVDRYSSWPVVMRANRGNAAGNISSFMDVQQNW